MDKLQKIASAYQLMLSTQYYFEISKKKNLQKFILSFEKSDFYHLAGLHKLTDIAVLQRERNKGKIFDKIVNGDITYDLIKHSRFFLNMNVRLELLESLENILDSNQIIFKYVSSKNQKSVIEADFLLEKAYGMNIVFMFLSDRNRAEMYDIPCMCCRSFFPMEHFDYTINQSTCTLLKKIKINIDTGTKIAQYDRYQITSKVKAAKSETERKSIMLQLNEKKALAAINEVLVERNNIQKEKQQRDI